MDPVQTAPDGAIQSPAVSRNREPILEVLRAHLPERARVLEIASGGGEHAAFLAAALPGVTWRPSDPSPAARTSIEAWRAASGLPNLLPPLALDAAQSGTWPDEAFDAVVCINMVHISPWAATEGLMAGAAEVLARGGPGGLLYLYGPYIEAGVDTAASNLAFDASLKARDPAWGLRERETVDELARSHRLEPSLRLAMPANNLSLIYRLT